MDSDLIIYLEHMFVNTKTEQMFETLKQLKEGHNNQKKTTYPGYGKGEKSGSTVSQKGTGKNGQCLHKERTDKHCGAVYVSEGSPQTGCKTIQGKCNRKRKSLLGADSLGVVDVCTFRIGIEAEYETEIAEGKGQVAAESPVFLEQGFYNTV